MMSEEEICENEAALAVFAKGESEEISPVLLRVLDGLRQTGVPYYPWPHLRALLVAKLKSAVDEMHAADKSSTVVVGWSPTNKNKYEERRNNLAAQLAAFEGPPFTLQRLAEVIMDPHKTYKTMNKLFNALEKLLAVTSKIDVVDPRNPAPVNDPEPPAPPAVAVTTPVAAPLVQGNADLDVVARAPWADGEATS